MSDSFDHLEEAELEWLRSRRRSAARRSWLLIGLIAIGFIAAILRFRGVSFGAPPAFLSSPNWPWLVLGIGLLAAGAVGALALGQLVTWRPLGDVERDLRAQQEKLEEQFLPKAIRPFLRDMLNKRSPSHETRVQIRDAPGLGEVFDPVHEIPISATERLKRLIDRMPGGSIGVSGPRGAGKTTLIRSFCQGRAAPANVSLSTVVSAPVEYTVRDFILHLFATLCQEVLGDVDDDRASSHGPGTMAGLGASFPVDKRLVRACGVVMLTTGATLLLLFARGIRVDARIAWGVALVLTGGILLALVPPAIGVRRAPLLPGSSDERRDLLQAVAARRLQEIRFQQTIASGWSGATKAPVGLEATVTASATLARVQLSFPEIVAMLRRFLALAAKVGPVLVGIDELDKLPSDQKARQFLNEIKAIFGVKDCYFLVSISEEAMASFGRRGLPFRDVFDSSFDEVVQVPYLSLDDAQRLLNRRVVVPMPFLCLCYCLSGGLARDLIRAARNLVEEQRDADHANPPPLALADAARALMREEVRVKTAATVTSFKGIDLEPEVSEMLEWCNRLGSEPVSPRDLLARCRWFSGEGRLRLGHGGDGEQAQAARQTLYRWIRELVSFYYYAATMLEFFDEGLDGKRMQLALSRKGGNGSFEQLATCRQAFSINPRLAWASLSAFRAAWRLEAVEFPEVLLWTRGAAAGGSSGIPISRPEPADIDPID